MSKTDDSDDLEFESADEDNQNDLSDLDLEEILDEDDKKSSKKEVTKPSEEKAQPKQGNNHNFEFSSLF